MVSGASAWEQPERSTSVRKVRKERAKLYRRIVVVLGSKNRFIVAKFRSDFNGLRMGKQKLVFNLIDCIVRKT